MSRERVKEEEATTREMFVRDNPKLMEDEDRLDKFGRKPRKQQPYRSSLAELQEKNGKGGATMGKL